MAGSASLAGPLIALERQLLDPALRADARRLGALLHPAFLEFGRSGLRHTRAEVLREFASGAPTYRVAGSEWVVSEVAPGVALVTYRTEHVGEDGEGARPTLRSSLWVRREDGTWTLRFHQGTPAADGTGSV